MLDCRSIPDALWEEASKRMFFFFLHHLGSENADELAQETLLAVWKRKDYKFEKEEDFLKVCHGFARKILLQAIKKKYELKPIELDPDTARKTSGPPGLEGAEVTAFLKEVWEISKWRLDEEERSLIESVIKRDRNDRPLSGRDRIRLYRLRKKLAKIIGWNL
jgi:DNA-directed RNA polymerase specialized sigma24 family protein